MNMRIDKRRNSWIRNRQFRLRGLRSADRRQGQPCSSDGNADTWKCFRNATIALVRKWQSSFLSSLQLFFTPSNEWTSPTLADPKLFVFSRFFRRTVAVHPITAKRVPPPPLGHRRVVGGCLGQTRQIRTTSMFREPHSEIHNFRANRVRGMFLAIFEVFKHNSNKKFSGVALMHILPKSRIEERTHCRIGLWLLFFRQTTLTRAQSRILCRKDAWNTA